MAENLDVGELRLPANILSDLNLLQQQQNHHHHDHHYYPSHHLLPSSAATTTMDGDISVDITRHLDALRFLHSYSSNNNQPCYSSSQPQHLSGYYHNTIFAKPLHTGSSISPAQTTPSLAANYGLVYSNRTRNVAQTQVDSYLIARARVLQQQKQQQQRKMLESMVRAGPNHFFASVRPSAMSSGSRECAGTGVFLPRVHTVVAVDNFDKNKNKPSAASTMKNTAEQQKQSRKAAAGVNGSRQGMLSQPLLPEQEMGELVLPPDWTY